jgi:hypothetical protein
MKNKFKITFVTLALGLTTAASFGNIGMADQTPNLCIAPSAYQNDEAAEATWTSYFTSAKEKTIEWATYAYNALPEKAPRKREKSSLETWDSILDDGADYSLDDEDAAAEKLVIAIGALVIFLAAKTAVEFDYAAAKAYVMSFFEAENPSTALAIVETDAKNN